MKMKLISKTALVYWSKLEDEQFGIFDAKNFPWKESFQLLHKKRNTAFLLSNVFTLVIGCSILSDYINHKPLIATLPTNIQAASYSVIDFIDCLMADVIEKCGGGAMPLPGMYSSVDC